MLKKITLLTLLALSVSFANVRVTTTTTDLASIAEYIGGSKATVTPLSRPLQDPHYLDATPGMVMRISRSDLFIENGLELELGWIPEVLRETRNRDVRRGGVGHVDASAGIKVIDVPQSATRDQGDVHPAGNPHYTLDLIGAQQAARNIADGFIRVDGANRAYYEANYEAFVKKSNEVLKKWEEKFAPYSGKQIIIYHKHFDYLLKRLGIVIADAVEPLPGIAPSAGHVARLLSRYDAESISFVLIEPWHDLRVGRQVANGIGVELIVGTPAVGACDESSCIITLFEANAGRFLKALKASER